MRLPWIIAALSSVLVLAWLSQQALDHPYQSSPRPTAATREQERDQRAQLEQQLDQSVSIHLQQPVSVRTWLAEFSREAGIAIEIADALPGWADEQTVELLIDDRPARTALDHLVDRAFCAWRIEEPAKLTVYPLDRYHAEHPAPKTVELQVLHPPSFSLPRWQLSESIRLLLDPDPELKRPNRFVASPGALVFAQPFDAQITTRDLFAKLQAQLDQAKALPKFGLAPDDPRLEPVELTALSNPRPSAKIQAALKQSLEADFDQVPLKECLARLTARSGIKIILPRKLDGDVPEDWPMTMRLSQPVSLKSILHLMLEPFATGFESTLDGEQIKIVANDSYYHGCRAYPVPDFGPAPPPGATDPLLWLLMNIVHKNSWSQFGGFAWIRRLDDVLLVYQSTFNHSRLTELLHALRMVRVGQAQTFRAWHTSPGRARVEQLLQQPLALHYVDVPLGDVATEIERRSGLRIELDRDLFFYNVENSLISCDLPERPLEENLLKLRPEGAPRNLNIVLEDSHVALTMNEAYSSYHSDCEVIDIRPFTRTGLQPAQLRRLLQFVVEPLETDSDLLGEYQDLLVVRQRRQMVAQVRHVLDVLHEHLLTGRTRGERGNLLTRRRLDWNDNDPELVLYAVDDLLAPRGKYSAAELLAQIKTWKVPNDEPDSELTIHMNRFLAGSLLPKHAETVAERLQLLRQ